MRGGTARIRGRALLGLGGIALALACGAAPPAWAQNSNAGNCTVMCDSQCSAQFPNHGSYNPIPACISRCVQQCIQGGNGGGGARSSYGSVYVTNDGSGKYGYSFGWNNQYDAMSEAQKHCRERAGGAQCLRLLIFVDRCAAVVQATRGGQIVDMSGGAEPSQGAADAAAIGLCERTNRGASCRIVQRFCSQ